MKILLFLIIAFTIYFVLGYDTRINTVEYNIRTNKLKSSVKMLLISDLHSCDYENKLVDKIDDINPDIILMTGDIIDDRLPFDKGFSFISHIGNRYDCYYVTGNHELRIDPEINIKKIIRNEKIKVLEGSCYSFNAKGSILCIYGLDDFEMGENLWLNQLNSITDTLNNNLFNILLTHRPEKADEYFKRGFDLTVSGHAHGGQWRFPKLINGFYSPNQGVFPKYAGGLYKREGNALIVSRGLAKESTKIPRLFNPPELVVININ